MKIRQIAAEGTGSSVHEAIRQAAEGATRTVGPGGIRQIAAAAERTVGPRQTTDSRSRTKVIQRQMYRDEAGKAEMDQAADRAEDEPKIKGTSVQARRSKTKPGRHRISTCLDERDLTVSRRKSTIRALDFTGGRDRSRRQQRGRTRPARRRTSKRRTKTKQEVDKHRRASFTGMDHSKAALERNQDKERWPLVLSLRRIKTVVRWRCAQAV